MSEEERPVDRLDLGGYQARKKQLEKNAVNWRETSRMATVDDLFKTIVAAKKGRANINRTGNNNSDSNR